MQRLFRLIKWALGGNIEPERSHSAGFSAESLLPEARGRDATERGICLACSVLTVLLMAGPPLARLELAPGWLAAAPEWLIAAPGAAWVGRTWLPRRRTMDRAAIGVGAFTLTPWLVPYTVGILLPLSAERLLCAMLGWQFLAVLATIGIGMGLDIAREIRDREPPS